MTSTTARLARGIMVGSIAGFVSFFSASSASAADDKECMSSASKGQEVRDKGQLVEARGHFQKCAQSTCPAPIPGYCRDWLADVGRKIPSVVVRAVDEGDHDLTDAVATIDDQPITLDGRAHDVDPGKHRVRISRPGKRTFETDIVAAQGEKDRIVVGKLVAEAPPIATPQPTPAPEEPKRGAGSVPTASWVAWGIGAAGLLSFAVFGIKARLDYDGYESTCGQQCTVSDRDSVATTVLIADISLVVGLVGAGVGTVFYLMRPTPSANAKANASSNSSAFAIARGAGGLW